MHGKFRHSGKTTPRGREPRGVNLRALCRRPRDATSSILPLQFPACNLPECRTSGDPLGVVRAQHAATRVTTAKPQAWERCQSARKLAGKHRSTGKDSLAAVQHARKPPRAREGETLLETPSVLTWTYISRSCASRAQRTRKAVDNSKSSG